MTVIPNLHISLSASCLLWGWAIAPIVNAQVIPDGSTPTSVRANVRVKKLESDLIQGGKRSRQNLFHSFKQFSIKEGSRVYFENPLGVRSIFSRVTGKNASKIYGRLGVLGNADLFLLNPNGIIFGPKASLDLKGAFTGSTAQSLVFGPRLRLSATTASPIPLVTLNIKPGAQLGRNFEGNILHKGSFNLNSNNQVYLEGKRINFSGTSSTSSLDAIWRATDGILIKNEIMLPPGQGQIIFDANFDEDAKGNFVVASENSILSNGHDLMISGVNLSLGKLELHVNSQDDTIAKFDSGSLKLEATGSIFSDSIDTSGQSGYGSGYVEIHANNAITIDGDINTSNQASATKVRDVNSSDIRARDAGGVSISTISGDISVKNINSHSQAYLETSREQATNYSITGNIIAGRGGDILLYSHKGNISFGNLNTTSEASSEVVQYDGENSRLINRFKGNLSADDAGKVFISNKSGHIKGNGSSGEINTFSKSESLTYGRYSFERDIVSNFSGELTTGNGGNVSITSQDGSINISQSINTSAIAGINAQDSSEAYSRQSKVTNILSGKSESGNAGDIKITTNTGQLKFNDPESQKFESNSQTFLYIDKFVNDENTNLLSGNLTSNNAGSIFIGSGKGDIKTPEIVAFSRSEVISPNYAIEKNARGGSKNGGNVRLSAMSGDLLVKDIRTFSYSNIGSAKNGGNINLIAEEGNVYGNNSPSDINPDFKSAILPTFSQSANNAKSGYGGDIVIKAKNKASDLSIFTFSANKSGNFALLGKENLILQNLEVLTSTTDINTDATSVDSRFIAIPQVEIGQSGDVSIESSGRLDLRNSRISNTTQSDRNAGTIMLSSPSEISLDGTSSINSESESNANAGSIIINAGNRLNLYGNSSISTSTRKTGAGGDITINSPNALTVSGSGILESTSDGSGAAGTILFNAHDLNLSKGVEITTSTSSTGKAGDINFDIDNNFNLNNAKVTSSGKNNDGGNINVDVGNTLFLANESLIATESTQRGDGGKIDINAQFIVAFPDNNKIDVTADGGDGGLINIKDTKAIFGDRFLTLDASSRSGNDGEVIINGLSIDPAQSLNQIPGTFVDNSDKLISACARDAKGQFIVTGRGGLPLSPLSQPQGLNLASDLGQATVQPSLISLPTQVASNQTATPYLQSATQLNQLLQQGRRAYQNADYTDAITHWTEAVIALEQGRDTIAYASTLNNLALAYHHLGDWEKAMLALETSQKTLKPETNSSELHQLAHLLNTQATLQFNRGNVKAAIKDWEIAAAHYRKAENHRSAAQATINQAIALQSLGYYNPAQTQLQQVIQTLDSASLEKAIALMNLGTIQRLKGDPTTAQSTLKQALSIAQSLGQPDTVSAIRLNLGHTAIALDQSDQAIGHYQQASESAPTAIAQFQSNLSLVALQLSQNNTSPILNTLKQQATALPASRESLFAQLHLAQLLLDHPGNASSQDISMLLTHTQQQGQYLEDAIAQAYALEFQSQLYANNQQRPQAKATIEQALQMVQGQDVPEVAYRLHWQLGQIEAAQNNYNTAVQAYTRATEALKILRRDLITANRDAQFNFRDTVEPIYREYVSLLLSDRDRSTEQQTRLKQALSIFDDLQVAELEDFLSCNLQTQTTPVPDSNSAFIYPIILEDRLELILQLPNNQPLIQYSTAAPPEGIDKFLSQLRTEMEQSYVSPEGLTASQQLYNWMIRPIEDRLTQQQISNLIFVLDGPLRNIPLAALHDGEQYLIEKGFAVAQLPSRTLFDDAPLSQQSLKAVSFGLANGNPPLPAVSQELESIQESLDARQYLDESFSSQTLQQQLVSSPRPILHLATHGQFSSDPDETYLETWDDKILGNELGRLLQERNESPTLDPIELLVLSACKTASGDSRAVLGLAGIAVRSGARSTLASLWAVKDESTALVMEEFYRQLSENPDISKAEALRRSQVKLLQNPDYKAPLFWSAYILVGNWQ